MANHGYCYKCKWFQPIRYNVGVCEFQTIPHDIPKEVSEQDYCPDFKSVNKKIKIKIIYYEKSSIINRTNENDKPSRL